MKNIVFILLRRMRLPLTVLVCAFAISTFGLTLVPGTDLEGKPWHMDFFHAFYFVSFLGTTIGLGEIPYPFSPAQRMWITFSIYLTVIAWIYALGTLLSILQDPAFRRVIKWSVFSRTVARLSEPFYIVCGYGDTGSLLVGELTYRRIQTVVIDINQERIDALALEDLGLYVPGLAANGADTDTLFAAGLSHQKCLGIMALTSNDAVNLKIASTSKLLASRLKVICRAEHHEIEANMRSFDIDHIVNPFDSFAERLGMAIHSPNLYLVYEWLTSSTGTPLTPAIYPPRAKWVVCGYGRFGKAVERYLTFEGMRMVIVEADPHKTHAPKNAVIGQGAREVTLREARIEEAGGIIAGTDNDTTNLSIIVTAKELKPNLFTIARQNQRGNDAIFAAVRPNLVMQPSSIIARRIFAIVTTPLLSEFLHAARHEDEAWVADLTRRISAIALDESPDTWTITISRDNTPAVENAIVEGVQIPLAAICADPHDRTRELACMPLLLRRGKKDLLLPDLGVEVHSGDRILFCGQDGAASEMRWVLNNINVLDYILTGNERPTGWVWRWLAGHHWYAP